MQQLKSSVALPVTFCSPFSQKHGHKVLLPTGESDMVGGERPQTFSSVLILIAQHADRHAVTVAV